MQGFARKSTKNHPHHASDRDEREDRDRGLVFVECQDALFVERGVRKLTETIPQEDNMAIFAYCNIFGYMPMADDVIVVVVA